MQIASPLSPALVLGVLLIPFVVATGSVIARQTVEDRRLANLLTPALALCALLLPLQLIGRHSGSFTLALTAAPILAALPGAVALLRRAPRWRATSTTARQRSPIDWRVLATVIGVTAFLIPAAQGNFHDELNVGGHWSIIAQFQNGWFPPRFANFPELELRYHYGFDLFAALLTAWLRVSIPTAIDLATLGGFAYSALLLCECGRRMVGTPSGALTAVLTLFAGGFPYFCLPAAAPFIEQIREGMCRVDGAWPNPPIAQYFFQHAFALGIPLALAALLLHSSDDRRPARYAGFALLFSVLSFSHIVLFATFIAALGTAECFSGRRIVWRRAAAMALAGAVALLVARLAGGFFAPSVEMTQHLQPRWGFTHTLGGSLEWNLRSYGVLLPFGLAGLVFLRRARLALTLIVGGAIVAPNVVGYALSWDMAKFATVATLALGIGLSASVAKLLAVARRSGGGRRTGCTLLAGVAVCGAMLWAVVFHLVYWLNVTSVMWQPQPVQLAARDVEILALLRARVAAGELVFRSETASIGYNQHGGLASPWVGPGGMTSQGSGLLPRFAARQALLRDLPADPEPYRRERMTWFALEQSDPLLGHAMRWVRDGQAELVVEHDGIRVVRLR